MYPASSTPTVLLLVDIQEGFKHPTHWGKTRSTPTFEANVAALLEAARRHNHNHGTTKPEHHAVQIIHVHHHSTSPDSPLHPSHHLPSSPIPSVAALSFAAPRAGEPIVTKHFNSAFVGTDLEARVRASGARQLVVAGLTTDHCVSTTARMAANLQVLGGDGDGGAVVVVGDATATFERGPFDADTVHGVHLASLDGEFAHVANTAAVLAAVFPG
ncbi:hypothetical protein GGTG_02025 [Gaeumannomyces tritici R3-111a-1]|uniref:Isochorismatase-like domain-containing protein n=1 Tax=Gaeumannomyces tritici (strain R3-111a-1) TaxID=644352 RepID=J3NL83_GAET3|nr:hypothetical protein GGTG_02025 [Gaeumannomyces tritici R3-111a-1]EJT82051.1 hypothetical protein GGTG_02025 [Gaeumannomyces tritici R3-111a-1]